MPILIRAAGSSPGSETHVPEILCHTIAMKILILGRVYWNVKDTEKRIKFWKGERSVRPAPSTRNPSFLVRPGPILGRSGK